MCQKDKMKQEKGRCKEQKCITLQKRRCITRLRKERQIEKVIDSSIIP